MIRTTLALAAALLLASAPALAHTGAGPVNGLTAGFGHPLGGLDHLLAMLAVGVLAAQLGGQALWAVPLAFVSMMLLGGVAGLVGAPLPLVEFGIAGSVVLLGGVVALGKRLPLDAAVVLAGALAVFHGHAHGTEMPAGAGALAYASGFVLATALLHGAGIAAMLGASRTGERVAQMSARAAGAVIALAGLAIAVG